MIFRGFSYKLASSPEQEAMFRQFSGVCRLIYNLALEQRRDWYLQFERETGRKIKYADQARELTALRDEFDWIDAVSVSCQQQALRDLECAFVDFFSGRVRFPTPRRKGDNDSFRFPGAQTEIRTLNSKWSEVRLPKIGWVKFRDTRPVRGIVKNVTVSCGVLGWYISFACEIEHEAPINICPAVGIDRGVVNTLALSTGELLSVPKTLDAIERRHRSAQRILSRRKKGSNRRTRQLRRCAKLSARRARIRRDWHHKAALDIANRFGTVVLEDLKIVGMTASTKGTLKDPGTNVRQKAGLNRAILNHGWGKFEIILSYKLAERGGRLAKGSPKNTSRECSECGCIGAENRKSQAKFKCVECGHEAHADTNAAINILRRWNTSHLCVEDGREVASEARTKERTTSLGNRRSCGRRRC